MSPVLAEPQPRKPVAGATVKHEGRLLRFERRITLLITLLPFIGAAFGIPLLWNRGVRALDVTLFLALYVITGMGVTVGFHRMLTHRSFDTVKPVKVALAIAGSMALQGSVISWVADHRRHHAYTDKPGDPHSPHLEEAEGLKGVLKGLWHAHTGWFFNDEKTNIEKFAPDLLRDKAIVKVSNSFPALAAISLILPAAIGLVVTQSFFGAVTAFIWGGLARIFFLHHVTWSINSICHFYGKRPFRSSDLSTNNWVMALLSFGEGWHNAHHAFPSSYKHGLERLQFDPSAWLINGLRRLGLAYNIKLPTPAQLAAKRA